MARLRSGEDGVTVADLVLAAIVFFCALFAGWWLLFYRPKK